MSGKKSTVIIKSEFCKGCHLCVEFCPQNVLGVSAGLNKSGYNYAEPVNPGKCTGCLICVQVCPDLAVEVYDE